MTTISQELVERVRACPVCGSAIEKRPMDHPSDYSRRKFCSRSCGTIAMNARHHEPVEDRLARLSEKDDETGCVNWTGPLKPDGYGRLTINGAPAVAHRTAYSLRHGEIPGGMLVCHRCDNRRCINPDHLFLGSNADNTADRNQKNRQARGETAGRAKLTDAQATELFHSTGTFRQVAERFGVSETTVSSIKNGRTWRHLGLTALTAIQSSETK